MSWLFGPSVRRQPPLPGPRATLTSAGVPALVPRTPPSARAVQPVLTEADFCCLIDARRRERARLQSDDTCPD